MSKRYSISWARFRRRRHAILVVAPTLLLVYLYNTVFRTYTGWSTKPIAFNWTSLLPDEANASLAPPCAPPESRSFQFVFPDNAAAEVTAEFTRLASAGQWRPSDCISNSSVVVIVPFRQRHGHLKLFLPYMHVFLQEKLLDYAIVVVQQPDGGTFNKARVMNAAFLEVRKLRRFDCYIFHDVDLLPLDRRMTYGCSERGPVHMAAAIDKFRYRLPYEDNFGGVTAFTSEQYVAVNGFSNRYFGWGAEDDDIYQRVRLSGQKVQRYPLAIARYHSLRHGNDPGNPKNPKRDMLFQQGKKTWRADGLNSLNYTVLAMANANLYLNITVDVH